MYNLCKFNNLKKCFFQQVMGMHESFKDADDRDDTNDSSIGTPGDLTDGRATLVPPSGFSTLQVKTFSGTIS
jgi:hypothetical protein